MAAAPNSAYAVSVDDTTGDAIAIPKGIGRKRLRYRNNGTKNIYLDQNPGVTSDTGFPLLPNDVVFEVRENGLDVQKPVYAVCASGESSQLRVWESD